MNAHIGIVTVSDRASQGLYSDESGPAIRSWLEHRLVGPFECHIRLIADGFEAVKNTLIELCDTKSCDLILTTGGTGPAPRDLTTEATLAIKEREYPGFGEIMRQASYAFVPTAILSRQTAVSRNKCLIINLPGKPAAIDICLNAVFPAVPYCLDLLGAARIETNPEVLKCFRPRK